ncbi:MAG TPA: hypothetical protein VG897_04800 [Terriglobales bacterium]|nr:hypothetical protein [Terriglobales bacterium]
MSSSFDLRKTVASCVLSLCLPTVLVAGTTGYLTNTVEYSIAGAMLGDQNFPQARVNANGGFLVWEDNAVDGFGTGIGAVALNSTFNKVGTVFRVNQTLGGDQEFPQVALLHGGGAVFTWQGGSASRQNIYARFLSANNTWLTGDVVVNSFTNSNYFRKQPSIATLANGNVVIVWSSYNQLGANSMLDVYGQIFTPAGQRVGGEFGVNQFPAFNQRNPVVAGLSGGGFVVAWVSEQQRSVAPSSSDVTPANYSEFGIQSVSGVVQNDLPVTNQIPGATASVDIYARAFDSTGIAQANEFAVNADGLLAGAPAIAAGSDGGYVIAWSAINLGAPRDGSDIYAKAYTASNVEGARLKVNTYTPGDQFIPSISADGTNYMLVWTSSAQDGSGMGVFGRVLKADGTPLGLEFQANRTVVSDQIQPSVASDGAGRFLTVWTSYVGGRNSFDLFGAIYNAPGYVPSAPANTLVYTAPVSDPYLAILPPQALNVGGSGSDNSATPAAGGTTPELPPGGIVPLDGASAAAVAATYNGLFYDTNTVALGSSGSVSIKTTAKQTYSAKLAMGGRSYSFSGAFTNGAATATVKRGGQNSLSVSLKLGAANGEPISGTVTDSAHSFVALLEADQAGYSKSSPVAAKKLTFAIWPAATTNAGYGFGTLKQDTAGNVQWAATLADGTKVSQSTTVAKSGFWPMYASLYSGSGSIINWMQFNSGWGTDMGTNIFWFKPATRTKALTGAFAGQMIVRGWNYAAPVSGGSALGFTSGNLVLNNGTGSPRTYALSVDSRGRVTSAKTNKLSLTITASTGLFQGSTLDPASRKPVSFQGVLVNGGTNGLGVFFGNNNTSGTATFSPQQ